MYKWTAEIHSLGTLTGTRPNRQLLHRSEPCELGSRSLRAKTLFPKRCLLGMSLHPSVGNLNQPEVSSSSDWPLPAILHQLIPFERAVMITSFTSGRWCFLGVLLQSQNSVHDWLWAVSLNRPPRTCTTWQRLEVCCVVHILNFLVIKHTMWFYVSYPWRQCRYRVKVYARAVISNKLSRNKWYDL